VKAASERTVTEPTRRTKTVQGHPAQSVACDLGVTGKLLRSTLVTRSAPPGFREALRRQLVDTAGGAIAVAERFGRFGAGSVSVANPRRHDSTA